MRPVRFLLPAVLLLILTTTAFAHKPTFNDHGSPSLADAFVIDEIETSLALYGGLPAATAVDYYAITVPAGHALDFQLFVPIACPETFRPQLVFMGADVPTGEVPDFIERPAGMQGQRYARANWGAFFEPFTRATFAAGPEVRLTAGTGTYYVAVFDSEGRTGTYLLSMGGSERFDSPPDAGARMAAYDRCEMPQRSPTTDITVQARAAEIEPPTAAGDNETRDSVAENEPDHAGSLQPDTLPGAAATTASANTIATAMPSSAIVPYLLLGLLAIAVIATAVWLVTRKKSANLQ